MALNNKKVKQSREMKNISIVDRGLKFNISKMEKEKNAWKFFSFLSIISTIILGGLVFLFSETTKMYVLNNQEAPVELAQIQKLPFTKGRVTTFVDEGIQRIYGLNYRFIESQLQAAKIYIDDNTYTGIINEMNRSNYITSIKQSKQIITLVPTPKVYKFKVNSVDDTHIWRSYLREKITGDTITREEITLRIRVNRLKPTEMHPWGLVIRSIKEESVTSF